MQSEHYIRTYTKLHSVVVMHLTYLNPQRVSIAIANAVRNDSEDDDLADRVSAPYHPPYPLR